MVDLVSALAALVRELEAAQLRYALGGALALGVWGVPRATRDIDLTCWCAPHGVPALFERLAALGVECDPLSAAREAESNGVAYVRWQGLRLDLFVPSIPFYDVAERTRARLDLPVVGPTWVLSAEALIVFKLLFFRPKDLSDIQSILTLRRDLLDAALIRRELVEMVGDEDPRTRWRDEAAARE
jgi:hypothetical protein